MMRPPSVSPEAVHAEQVKQQQLLIQSVLLETQRLEDVGHPLLVAATGFCERYVTVRSGFTLANAHTFGGALELAARSVGFSDSMVLSVVAAIAKYSLQINDLTRLRGAGRRLGRAIPREDSSESPAVCLGAPPISLTSPNPRLAAGQRPARF